MSNKSYALRSYRHCVQKYSRECEIFKFFVGSTYTNFVEITVQTSLSIPKRPLRIAKRTVLVDQRRYFGNNLFTGEKTDDVRSRF